MKSKRLSAVKLEPQKRVSRRSKADDGLPQKILEFCKVRGIWAWRQNSGKVQTRHGSWIQLAPKGTPDILGVLPGGKLFAIECKRPGEAPSDCQHLWLEQANAMGAHASWFDDFEDAVEWLEECADFVLRSPKST